MFWIRWGGMLIDGDVSYGAWFVIGGLSGEW